MPEVLTFKIEDFEGPLDLLLYLVGKNKMNLYDVNIMELIEQYTAAIREMQQDRMEISSEFIDMAAHLVQMKSALLLPRSPEAERMKAELTGRLIEYSACKEVAAQLGSRARDLYTVAREPMPLVGAAEYTRRHDPKWLVQAWFNLMGRSTRKKKPTQEKFEPLVTAPFVSVASRVSHMLRGLLKGSLQKMGQHFVFEDEGCCIPTSECGKFDALPPEYSHLYLAIGGVLAGVICIADPLREEASEVLKQLRGLGIRKAVMMTGDNDRTASVIAKQVGVDRYYAEVLPEDKANFVEQEKAAGHTVIMLGDGINDSPALSAADVGIAISDGAAIAREIADVTIAADSLRELVILKSIANGLQKRTESNYLFIMSFNSTLIVLGAMGILPPATSALLHNASTLGVSLKSMTNLLD